MPITFLEANLKKGQAVCRFTARHGGTRAWVDIVDAFKDTIVEVCMELDVPSCLPEGRRLLGQGALVTLPMRVFLEVRRRFKRLDVVKKAKVLGEFQLIVDSRLLRKIRANNTNRTNNTNRSESLRRFKKTERSS